VQLDSRDGRSDWIGTLALHAHCFEGVTLYMDATEETYCATSYASVLNEVAPRASVIYGRHKEFGPLPITDDTASPLGFAAMRSARAMSIWNGAFMEHRPMMSHDHIVEWLFDTSRYRPPRGCSTRARRELVLGVDLGFRGWERLIDEVVDVGLTVTGVGGR